jgi:hypothetical protein
VWLFTNEHEQVLKNLGTFIEECFNCEDTTDPVDIIILLPIKVPQGANNLIQWLKWLEAYKDTCKKTKSEKQKKKQKNENIFMFSDSLFTNEHEQVLQNLGTFIEECVFTARTQLIPTCRDN